MKRLISASATLLVCLTAVTLYAQTRPTPKPTPKPAPNKPGTKPVSKTTPPAQPKSKTNTLPLSQKPTVKPVILPTPKPTPRQESPQLPPPTVPLEPKSDKDQEYYPSGKLVHYESTAKGEIISLLGDGKLLHQETKFFSDKVFLNRTTEIASAPGKVRLEDPQNTVTGDSGVTYYQKSLRYADIVGSVVIVARPKPSDPKATGKSPRREFKNPVTITCDKLRYWWKQKRGFTDTNVKITFLHNEKNWTITGGSLEYFGNDEHALIKGSVIAVSDKGDRILSDTADITLKEGSEKLILTPLLPGSILKGKKDDEGDGDGRP